MPDLKLLLSFHNPWWLTYRVPHELNLPFRRPIFDTVYKYLSLDRIIILKGPRRTGKSTLMFQLIHELLQKGVAPQRILYLPFDDPDLTYSFYDIILEFEKQLGREISQGPEVYCLLDEIQQLDNWSGYLKKYADKKWPVKFIVSGSSASLIKEDAESLAGRTVEEIILPFSFYEFLLFHATEVAELLRDLHDFFDIFEAAIPAKATLIERKIAILFEKYLFMGGFPGLFGIKEPLLRKKLLQEDIIEKVIYRDLVKRYGIKKPDILEKLFLYLVNQSSDILNITSIANSLKLSREVTQDYIRYLREAYLIMITPRYASSIETEIRTNPKVYVMDAGFMSAFSALPIGKRVESIVANHLYFKNPHYFRSRLEVDFILQSDDRLVPIEVKFRNKITTEHLAGLKAFHKKTPYEKSIVITKNLNQTQDQTIFIPAYLFLAFV